MKYRPRIYYTESQNALMWERCAQKPAARTSVNRTTGVSRLQPVAEFGSMSAEGRKRTLNNQPHDVRCGR